jgi:protease IV
MKKNMHKGGLIVFCIIILFAVLAAVWALFFRGSGSSRPKSQMQFPEQNNNAAGSIAKLFGKRLQKKSSRAFESPYIAAIYIEGTIEDANRTYNQEWLLDTIDDLSDDSSNKALILYIDSPGGGVYQSDEVYLALKDYKKNTGRPICAYMGPLAASGGYYIACAADNLSANRNTLTGSIGVIAGESIDVTGLLKKYGIKATTIHAGKNKNMLNFNEPLTDEQKAIMQAVADEAYDQFTGIVAGSRKMNIATVKKLADGRIYTAKQALGNNLIDRICTWDEAITALEDNYLKGETCGVQDYRYEQKESFYDMLIGSVSKIGSQKAAAPFSALEAKAVEMITPAIPFPAYYYAGR